MSIFRLFCLFFTLFLLGCESYHPNPELLDPIFKEYSEKAGENKKEIELIDKIIEQSELELLDEKPTKIKRMAVIADLNRLKEEKRLFTQKKILHNQSKETSRLCSKAYNSKYQRKTK